MIDSVMFSGDGEVDACVGDASGIGEEEVWVGEASVVAYGNDEASVALSGKDDGDTCQGEASVVLSGKGDGDAGKGEASVVLSGKRNYAVKRTSTAEFPCVKRLRERRLLSFLWDQGFHGAFEALNHETIALFSVQHMQRLVVQGRWADALVYLNAYLPPITENHKRSRRAQIFHNFLLMFYRISKVIGGDKEKHLEKEYAGHRWCSSDAELRFRSITYPILASEPHQLMASYDWDKVRGHATFLVYILAHTTPELRRSMPLPSRYMMPHHVLPIGSSLHRRRHRVVRKQGPRERDTVAIFMALKSQHHRDPRAESPNEALKMLVDCLDQTLQAGLRKGCNLSYPPQPSVKEGVPDAPYVQTMLGNSTGNAKGHAASSVKISGAPFCQIISRTSKVHSQNPGISSVTNAGTNKRFIQEGCHTENPSKGSTIVEDDIYQKNATDDWGVW